ncbi:hypothetical protein N7540_012952 [Penicillium herquei]|nr:hypothetical protein N7540_013259 [Penicillium herquei]KAJ6004583.1 hypothetical protein N7540_012952 [Penicillium herquei]
MAVLPNAAGIFPMNITAKEIVKAQGLDIDISGGPLTKLTDQRDQALLTKPVKANGKKTNRPNAMLSAANDPFLAPPCYDS